MALLFVVEGHCDERGSEEYNLALGDARAEVVAEYLKNNGISKSRITTISMGEERPFDNRKVEAAYALNRRAHFVLLKVQ
jgi:peptidoglycan-associated lipoprotein